MIIVVFVFMCNYFVNINVGKLGLNGTLQTHIKSATTTAFVLFIWTMMPKIMNGQSRNLYHIVYSSFFSFLLHFNSTFKWIFILLLPQKAGYAICSTKFTKIVLLTPILQYLPVFLSKTPSVLIITIVFREYNW